MRFLHVVAELTVHDKVRVLSVLEDLSYCSFTEGSVEMDMWNDAPWVPDFVSIKGTND